MCKFLSPLQDVFVCVSVVTHTAIALERYRAIVKSMLNKISVTATKAVICVTWFSCYVSAALPIAVISRTEEHNNQVFCTIRFPTTTFRRVYEVYLVVVFIILPIAVQIWAYFCMSKVVSKTFSPQTIALTREAKLWEDTRDCQGNWRVECRMQQ